jgi:hypothetical protein
MKGEDAHLGGIEQGIGVSQQILTVPKHEFKSEPWHERFGSSMAGRFTT